MLRCAGKIDVSQAFAVRERRAANAGDTGRNRRLSSTHTDIEGIVRNSISPAKFITMTAANRTGTGEIYAAKERIGAMLVIPALITTLITLAPRQRAQSFIEKTNPPLSGMFQMVLNFGIHTFT